MTTHPEISSSVVNEFGQNAAPQKLPGGSTEVSRVGDIIIKHISEQSLENDHSPELAGWIAQFSATLPQEGFRIPKGVSTVNGDWITPDGWTGWTFVAGRHATSNDIPQCIAAIQKFHHALRAISKHPLLDSSDTHWARAQRWCLGEKPDYIHPAVEEYMDALYQLRKPVIGSPDQLMHGDLNPENILVADGLSPAFIDFSPFWGPPELAMAIFANFIGPRKGDESALDYFRELPNFNQWLIRAGIRMLLVMSDGGHLEEWDTCSEKTAAEIIIRQVQSS